MKLSLADSDDAVLRELGDRLSRYRLNRNQTQASLAEEAGVSLRTVIRMEQGESVQVANWLRILRGLDLLDNLEALVPAPAVSPIQQVRMQGKRRQRASSPAKETSPKPWRWADGP